MKKTTSSQSLDENGNQFPTIDHRTTTDSMTGVSVNDGTMDYKLTIIITLMAVCLAESTAAILSVCVLAVLFKKQHKKISASTCSKERN